MAAHQLLDGEAVDILRPFPEAYARFAAQHDSNDMRLFAVSTV